MKTHIFVGMLINAWVLFGVIYYNRNVSKLVYSRLLCIEHLCNAMGHTTMHLQDSSPLLQCIFSNGP